MDRKRTFIYIKRRRISPTPLKYAHMILNFYSATSFMLNEILPILSFPRQTTLTTSPQRQNVFYMVDSLLGNLRNVNHSFFARSKF